tara:strand:- start:3527 stop:3721 length:195 start_codon:yes stop_codon:yes gene_type:complete
MAFFDNDDRSYLTWLSSKEAQKLLNISGCELMHLRESDKLTFKKQGNAFLYQIEQKPINKNQSE